MNEDVLKEHIQNGLSQRGIAAAENKSQGAVRYWLNKYNLKTLNHRKTWSEPDLVLAVKRSQYMSDVLKELGLQIRPGNYDTLKRYIKKLNLDTSHFLGKWGNRGGNKKIPHDKLFTANSPHSRSIVKRRIITENLIEYECAICNITEWNGVALSLVLDHINGVNDDNRLKNLRFLCPNCNSLQDTFCRKLEW